MSTPFYARYIPPPTPKLEAPASTSPGNGGASKKRKRDSALSPESIHALTEVKKPSIKTQKPVGQGVHVNTQQLKKKEDRAAARDGIPKSTQEADTQLNGNRSGAHLEQEEKLGLESKKKKNKRKSEDQDAEHKSAGTQDVEAEKEQAVDEDTKHKKIRSKFEKSVRRAARLAEKEKASKVFEGGHEDEPEAPVETYGLVPLPQPEEVPDTFERPTFSALPPWLANPIVVSSSDSIAFESLPLSPSVLDSLQKKGYSRAFAVQSAVLPLLLPGPRQDSGDICISASTGSGKTLSYVLPMVESLRGKPITRLRGLVVVPTRELVSQVRETCDLCASRTGLKIGTAVGSKSIKEEQVMLVKRDQRYDPEGYRAAQNHHTSEEDRLVNWDIEELCGKNDEFTCLPDFVEDFSSNVDILICTPGRLVDHLQSTKGFTLKHVQWLAIDEADRLLDQSFQQWIDIVMQALRAQEPRDPREEVVLKELHIKKPRLIRKIVLSATMTRDISKLTGLELSRPKMVVLDTSHGEATEIQGNEGLPGWIDGAPPDPHLSFDLPATLEEVAIAVGSGEDKPLYLLQLLANDARNHGNGQTSKSVDGPTLTARRNPISDDTGDDSYSESDFSSDSDSSSTSSSDITSSSSASEPETTQNEPSIGTSSTSSNQGVLIFTNNNENALRLARLLALLQPSWESEIGSLTASSATSSSRRTLAAFRKRKLSILVASDRASRGLDIKDLAHVINYDLPTSLTSYVHRVGRTARAGKEGIATTFVSHREARWFWNEIARSKQIKRAPGKKMARMDVKLEAGDKERKGYEAALGQLGREAHGERT